MKYIQGKVSWLDPFDTIFKLYYFTNKMQVQGFNITPGVSEEHIAHSCGEISITENFSTFNSISVTLVG